MFPRELKTIRMIGMIITIFLVATSIPIFSFSLSESYLYYLIILIISITIIYIGGYSSIFIYVLFNRKILNELDEKIYRTLLISLIFLTGGYWLGVTILNDYYMNCGVPGVKLYLSCSELKSLLYINYPFIIFTAIMMLITALAVFLAKKE